MKFPHPIPVTQIARKIGAELLGDTTLMATGINEIHKVEPGDITFSDVKKYFQKSLDSAATIIILNERVDCPPGKALLVCEKPFDAYDGLLREYRPFEPRLATISKSAEIHPTAILEPGVIVAANVRIGRNTYIQANTVINEYTYIGDDVIIEPNCTIGCDAFYFKKYSDSYTRWRSGGRTIIADHVHIGAGCTIAKGVSGDTVIGEGTKIDCQVQIGHGVVLGKNCLLAAQVGIAGKTRLGDNVIIYGQVGVTQNLNIGNDVIVLAKSGVGKDLEAGKTYFGAPCREVNIAFREVAALRMLPDFIKKKS